MKIFAVTNQKGGVGKTTTSINLAASFSAHSKRVLLVDLDPQGNATMGSGIVKTTLQKTIYHLLLGIHSIHDVCLNSKVGYDILPANRELAGAEIELVSVEKREIRLKSILNTVENIYDYVLLDCPPALSLLTVNALAAANAVIIPMQCEYFALEGLSDLVSTIRRIRQSLNPGLEIEGLLRTMYDPRNTLATHVSSQLEQHFGPKVFTTIIPRNIRLAEAPSYGLPVMNFDRSARGSQAYEALASEIILRGANN